MHTQGLIGSVDSVRKKVRPVRAAQIFSAAVKGEIAALAGDYFSTFRPAAVAAGTSPDELGDADNQFRQLHQLAHKSPSKAKVDSICKDARNALVKMDGSRLQNSAVPSAARTSKSDELIISSLKDVCKSAASAYEQALRDLQGSDRLSWRGPATDTREARRETLDAMAPDSEIEKMQGYKLEENAQRSTMRQKAKYILKNREMTDNQASLSETAIEKIENAVSGITRSVYVRSNVSTHSPMSRDEVARLRGWVRLVMCDPLSLPILD